MLSQSFVYIATENIQRNVDSKKIDSDLLKNPTVLLYAITIKDVINQQKKYVKK